jgi:hypothetical protein
MAKPNYAFERRQRDLAKKQKSEEKRKRKAAERAVREPGAPPSPVEEQDKPK